jgi:DHA2 family multidrug resistance protein
VIVPQWQQAWLGFTATQAGHSSSFTAIAALLTAPIVVLLMPRFDPRLLISAGIVLLAVIGLTRTLWTVDYR